MWVRAMVTYDRVAKNIEPKKAKLAEAEAELAKTNEQLAKKKASLQVRPPHTCLVHRILPVRSRTLHTDLGRASLEFLSTRVSVSDGHVIYMCCVLCGECRKCWTVWRRSRPRCRPP